jgi:dolichol-phosphate mannosyltransferase
LHDDTPDTGCGIKIIRRDVFLRLPYFDHMHRFLPALVRAQGGQVKSLPVRHRERVAGVSKYGFFDRLWVGISDIVGVMWLVRRSRLPSPLQNTSGHAASEALGHMQGIMESTGQGGTDNSGPIPVGMTDGATESGSTDVDDVVLQQPGVR